MLRFFERYFTTSLVYFSVNTETFLLPDLGKLKRMKVLHDNSGTAPSWFLDKVSHDLLAFNDVLSHNAWDM